MSEDPTQNIAVGASLEERIFAQLTSINARLQSLEEQDERRALETKPIWERALAEILEVKEEVIGVKERVANLERLSDQLVRKVDVLGRDMLTLRAEQEGIHNRLEKLESEPTR